MTQKDDRAKPDARLEGFEPKPYVLPLEDELGHLFRDTYRLISRRLQEMLERYGLGNGQWALMRIIWSEDGLTQRELSTRVGMGEPNVVTALRDLERRGYIRRFADEADGRVRRVESTPAGRRLEQELEPIAAALHEKIGSALSPEEREQLRSLVRRVRAGLLEG